MNIKYRKEFMQLLQLAETHGYWSAEVLQYNSSIPMHKRNYINELYHAYEKGYVKQEEIKTV